LDSFLENNLSAIKDLFGYDSDGDLIIDNGIGYLLDKQLSAWVQTGGILSNKISSLTTRIDASNKKISQLETQLEQKEAELKNKYATMQGTLNSLESQQTSISNWANQGNNNR
jgi:flagellar hook-associated protein 2